MRLLLKSVTLYFLYFLYFLYKELISSKNNLPITITEIIAHLLFSINAKVRECEIQVSICKIIPPLTFSQRKATVRSAKKGRCIAKILQHSVLNVPVIQFFDS
jgi:hypothetical protein